MCKCGGHIVGACTCKSAGFTPAQKLEVLDKVLEFALKRAPKYWDDGGDRIIPESVQDTLRILFPRGMES